MSKRLNLVLSEDANNRMENLKKISSTSSATEIVKRALQLYEDMLQKSCSGVEFLQRDTTATDSKPFRYTPFGGL